MSHCPLSEHLLYNLRAQPANRTKRTHESKFNWQRYRITLVIIQLMWSTVIIFFRKITLIYLLVCTCESFGTVGSSQSNYHESVATRCWCLPERYRLTDATNVSFRCSLVAFFSLYIGWISGFPERERQDLFNATNFISWFANFFSLVTF